MFDMLTMIFAWAREQGTSFLVALWLFVCGVALYFIVRATSRLNVRESSVWTKYESMFESIEERLKESKHELEKVTAQRDAAVRDLARAELMIEMQRARLPQTINGN